MQVQTIQGYKVTIFKGYNGTQLFISDANGVSIYAHKVSGNPIDRAREVISQQ